MSKMLEQAQAAWRELDWKVVGTNKGYPVLAGKGDTVSIHLEDGKHGYFIVLTVHNPLGAADDLYLHDWHQTVEAAIRDAKDTMRKYAAALMADLGE